MNAKSKLACTASVRQLIGTGWAYLWTLTTPDVVDLKQLSQRWRKLVWNGFTPCVRVFERHPKGHGYHVHFVTSERIAVDSLRPKTDAVGFGRIHVRRIPGAKATYIAKYLTKQRGQRGVRMWSCVAFKGAKVADVVIEKPRISYTHWEDGRFVLKPYPPRLELGMWVPGYVCKENPRGALVWHEVWRRPPLTKELARLERTFPLADWSDRLLFHHGYQKRGYWLTVVPGEKTT